MLRLFVFVSAFFGVLASAHATDYQCYCKFCDATYLVSPAAKGGAIYATDNKGVTRFYGNISGDVTYDYTNASDKKRFDEFWMPRIGDQESCGLTEAQWATVTSIRWLRYSDANFNFFMIYSGTKQIGGSRVWVTSGSTCLP